jgi:flagellar biosynthesis regulator FlaF
MRPSLVRLTCRNADSHRRRDIWYGPRAWLLLAAVVALGCVVLAGEPVEAQSYSAYSDPEKPVLSFVLSDEANVEEFQSEFGLTEDEVEAALAAVREENEALAREYAESEQLVESNEGLPEDQVRARIDSSDYDERVRTIIAETKATVEGLLPEDRRADLESWVNGKFAEGGERASEDNVTVRRGGSSKGPGVRCEVFATQYNGYTRYEVALPHRNLKDKYRKGRPAKVTITRKKGRIKAPVKEVGPWNIRDNYWQSRRKRDNFDNLRRCKPEAEAAYFNNYNHGRDQFGRKVLNPAGVDLTPRAAKRLGLRKYQNAWVWVRYPWVER